MISTSPLVGGVRGGGTQPSELKGKRAMCIRVTLDTVEYEKYYCQQDGLKTGVGFLYTFENLESP